MKTYCTLAHRMPVPNAVERGSVFNGFVRAKTPDIFCPVTLNRQRELLSDASSVRSLNRPRGIIHTER